MVKPGLLLAREELLRAGKKEEQRSNNGYVIVYWEPYFDYIDGVHVPRNGFTADIRAGAFDHRIRRDTLAEVDAYVANFKRALAIRDAAKALSVPIPPEGQITKETLK